MIFHGNLIQYIMTSEQSTATFTTKPVGVYSKTEVSEASTYLPLARGGTVPASFSAVLQKHLFTFQFEVRSECSRNAI